MITDWKDFRRLALDLTQEGYVPIFGEFCDELEEVIVECILTAKLKGYKELTLLISSNGGQNTCFNGIKAAMTTLADIKFAGLVMSRAYSNGFRLLQHCDKRTAIRDAYLMFHWGWSKLNNSELAALMDGEDWPLSLTTTSREAALQETHQRTGISIEDLKRYAVQERFFTAEQALGLNMIDEIIEDLPAKVHAATKTKKK